MNLYRSKGRIWTGTQADAKEAQGGKDFEHRDVPTDKAGLIAFLNEMEARVGMAGPSPDMAVQSPVDPEDAPAWDEAVFARAEIRNGDEITRPATGTLTSDDCPACQRSRRVAKIAANSQAAINIMADLEDVTDIASLQRISDAMSKRISAVIEATPEDG